MLTTVLIFVAGFFLGAMTIHSWTAAAQGSHYVSPVIEKFDLWGTLTPDRKLMFYSGWANGLFTDHRRPGNLTKPLPTPKARRFMWLRKTEPCLELLTVPGLPSSLKFSTDGTKLISGPQLALSP